MEIKGVSSRLASGIVGGGGSELGHLLKRVHKDFVLQPLAASVAADEAEVGDVRQGLDVGGGFRHVGAVGHGEGVFQDLPCGTEDLRPIGDDTDLLHLAKDVGVFGQGFLAGLGEHLGSEARLWGVGVEVWIERSAEGLVAWLPVPDVLGAVHQEGLVERKVVQRRGEEGGGWRRDAVAERPAGQGRRCAPEDVEAGAGRPPGDLHLGDAAVLLAHGLDARPGQDLDRRRAPARRGGPPSSRIPVRP